MGAPDALRVTESKPFIRVLPKLHFSDESNLSFVLMWNLSVYVGICG